ncbi:hypothetical protein [Photobacterium minamisatsumaniensis]|uniref:hypothetical protein n=1 Tax=Photobacterium minamisatsumaniensis TaxID=2910233 RepID=UPI003D0D24D6
MKMELKVTALAAAIFLSGCASDSDSTASLPLESNQTELAVQTNALSQDIDNANELLKTAKQDELSWFATIPMREANNALKEAKEYYAVFETDPSKANSSIGFFSSKTNIQAAEEAINNFNINVNKANDIRKQSLLLLDEAFSYRAQLNTIESAKYYPRTTDQLEKDLKRLVDFIATNRSPRAISGQPDLVTKQRALEVKTITNIYLTPAKKELTRLNNANVSLHAPDTLAAAAASLAAAEAFIVSEPRAIAKIQDKAAEAMFSLKHAGNIGDVVKKLKAMPESNYERHVLSFEKILLNISVALGAEDMRDQPIGTHGKNLAAVIKQQQMNSSDSKQAQQQLIAQLAQEQSKVEQLTQNVAALSLENERIALLEAEVAQLNTNELTEGLTDSIEDTTAALEEMESKTSESTVEDTASDVESVMTDVETAEPMAVEAQSDDAETISTADSNVS